MSDVPATPDYCPVCGEEYNISIPHSCPVVTELAAECKKHLENLNERDARIYELEEKVAKAIEIIIDINHRHWSDNCYATTQEKNDE